MLPLSDRITAMDPVSSDTASRRRAWRGMAIRVLASVAVLGGMLFFVSLDQLLLAFRRIPLSSLALAVGFYLVLHLVGAIKWKMMVDAAGGGLKLREAVRCHYYGLFGNLFLPSVVGGDVVRVGLAMKLGRSATGVATGSVAERALDVLALATVAGIGVVLFPSALDEQSRQVFWGLALVGCFVGLAAVGVVFALRRAPFKLKRIVARVRSALRVTARRPGAIAGAFLLGVCMQTLLALLNAWLGQQCGIDIPLTAWLFAWPMAKISALVPVTQGGLGVREAALAALLLPLGTPVAVSLAAGLVFQAVIFSGGLFGGMLALTFRTNRAQSYVSKRTA